MCVRSRSDSPACRRSSSNVSKLVSISIGYLRTRSLDIMSIFGKGPHMPQTEAVVARNLAAMQAT